ncbi:MAG: Swt1 family HEPN domain-containing protein, partial [Anaerolineae bacterium]|nr:Swt1 family HEPN domain-containing protein [Anaerolineae bacterium]
VIEATRIDARKLEAYQLIKPATNGHYEGFTDHFTQYLQARARDVDLWELWTKTERALRDFVEDKMRVLHGSDWENKLATQYDELRLIFEKCRRFRENSRKFQGDCVSTRLIDYASSPMDYWAIIELHWSRFSPPLQGTKKEWQKRFELIKAVRDPMAHSAEHTLPPDHIKRAEIFCKELLDAMQNSTSSQR